MISSSQVGSHKDRASLIAQQVNALERKMTATSGRRCLEQFRRFSRPTSWAKTFAGLLIGMEGWYSTRCGLTWKLSGMKFSRFYFQLVPSTHRTGATEYGLLPTPTVSDTEGGETNTVALKKGRFVRTSKTTGTEFGAKIQHVAKLLPTPTAMDTGETTDLKKLDLRREKAKATGKNGNGFGQTIGELAQRGLLPTPIAQDVKGGKKLRPGKTQLTEAIGASSQLNPRFVLEMMGFPTDWTEAPFLKQQGPAATKDHIITAGETNP